jgi:transposase
MADKPKYQDKEWLERRYCVEEMSAPEIAREMDVSSTTIYSWMERLDVERRSDRTVAERFWHNVDKDADGSCWEWTAAKGGSGQEYGVFFPSREDQWYAHRFSYKLANEDPADEMVLHKCDNPPCVNPDHLYLGDNSDNIEDAYNRDRRSAKGEANPKANLSVEEVRQIKSRLDDESCREIAEDLDIPRSTVVNISAGVSWEHV